MWQPVVEAIKPRSPAARRANHGRRRHPVTSGGRTNHGRCRHPVASGGGRRPVALRRGAVSRSRSGGSSVSRRGRPVPRAASRRVSSSSEQGGAAEQDEEFEGQEGEDDEDGEEKEDDWTGKYPERIVRGWSCKT